MTCFYAISCFFVLLFAEYAHRFWLLSQHETLWNVMLNEVPALPHICTKEPILHEGRGRTGTFAEVGGRSLLFLNVCIYYMYLYMCVWLRYMSQACVLYFISFFHTSLGRKYTLLLLAFTPRADVPDFPRLSWRNCISWRAQVPERSLLYLNVCMWLCVRFLMHVHVCMYVCMYVGMRVRVGQ